MSNKKKYFFSVCIALIIFLLGFNLSNAAQIDLLPEKNDSTDKTLHIKADKLVYDRNSLYILFTGNAQATYDNMTINSDDLKVTYLDNKKDKSQSNEGKIDKIIASGHVVIKVDGKNAYCDQAVYTAETKTIVLTGENAKIENQGNYITGDKIIIQQLTGQIVVDGSPEKRVNAVFKPNNNSTDIFGNPKNDEKK